MKTSEIVIVSLQDVGDAVFVNGIKIYVRTSNAPGDSSYSAKEVGQRLATSLGVTAFQVDASRPDKNDWQWEEIFQAARPQTVPPVAVDDIEVGLYWDRRRYGQAPASNLANAFHMRLQDQRARAGRLTVSASASTNVSDNTLFATMAIDRVPGYDNDTQAIHIKRDSDAETLIVFKQDNGYLLLPPTGATVRPVIIEDDLPAYMIS